MQKLIFVTSNHEKAIEVEKILEIPIEVISLELDEIQDLDPKRIVIQKAEKAFRQIKQPLLVDDVSVNVHVWGEFPGPFIKFLLRDNNALFRRLLSYESDRSAAVLATIGYHDGKYAYAFTGSVEGEFHTEPRGNNRFGFDPLFIPEGCTKTFAEMSVDEKNEVSHRRRALDLLKAHLANYSQ